MVEKVTDPIPRKIFTVNSFLTNPTGDAGTNAQARKLVLEDMSKKMNGLLNMGRKFDVKFFKAGKSIFVKVIVPSETFEDFGYDVLIEFEEYDSNSGSLQPNHIRFFSNSPSFVYTYAHVFHMFGILIDTLIKKYPEAVFKEIPDTRNPDFTTFYEKSITMALLYLREKDLLSKRNFDSLIKTIPLSKVKDHITASQDKELEYKMHQAAESKRKKAEKEKKKAERDSAKKADKPIKSSKIEKTTNSKVSNKVSNRVDSKINNRVNNKVNRKVK